MIIRRIEKKDLPEVTRVHIAAFPNFFMTLMGPTFLKEYYYSVNKMPDGIVLGCFDEDSSGSRLLGFCAEAVVSAGFNKRMLCKRFIPFSIQSLRLLFINPGALLHFANNLTKGPDSKVSDPALYGELLSIAVDPTVQGKGVGKALINAVEQLLLKQGQQENSLTTDAVDNNKTISFYRKNNYEVFYQFTAYPNRRMLRMNKQLSQKGI